MFNNKDKRTPSEKEIDAFLEQFEDDALDAKQREREAAEKRRAEEKRLAQERRKAAAEKKQADKELLAAVEAQVRSDRLAREKEQAEFERLVEEKKKAEAEKKAAEKQAANAKKAAEKQAASEKRAAERKAASEKRAVEKEARSAAKAARKQEKQEKKAAKLAAAEASSQGKKRGFIKRIHTNKYGRFSFLKVIRNLVVLGVICAIIGVGYAAYVILNADEIDPANIYDYVSENSTVLDDDGKVIDTVFYTENRSLIPYDEMPENLVNAFIAIEDKTFWEHHGFNWTRMFGAIFDSVLGDGRISGTSTITQQLARNVFLPEEKSVRSIKRKVTEMYYAYEIERALSKEQIMEAYLNSVYFGFGAYGVDAASDKYFSKKPEKLELVECAALAALPQMPDKYALVKYAGDGADIEDTATDIIMREPETYLSNDLSSDRRDLCLDLMLEQGFITQEEHDEAYEKPLKDFIDPDVYTDNSNYSYFNDYLLEQVSADLQEKLDITEDEAERMIYTGGLTIYSTLDRKAQDVIVKEFQDDSNYPYLTSIKYDGNDNIIASDGTIMLYDYDSYFTQKGNFKFAKDEATVNDDGSVTIKRGKRVNIYTTESGGNVDYSLEFKSTYVMQDYTLYIYSGGYINIPAAYKSLDNNDDLVISADLFTDYPEAARINEDNQLVIYKEYFTLAPKSKQPQSAMVIVENGTGAVKAMVGGRETKGRQMFNRCLNPRQPGSSIKPLAVYSASLQKSLEYEESGQKFPYVDYGHDKQGTKYYGDYLTASSIVLDEKMNFDGKTWPVNVDGTYRGAVTMRQGMRNSLNTVAVKLEMQIGNEYASDLLKKYGLTTIVTDVEETYNDMNPAALALGGLTNGAIPLEMAQAYAAFPNKGVRQSSIAYTKVEDRDGEVILESDSKSTQVIDPGVAFITCDMLQYNVTSGFSYGAALTGVKSGGKSGTTNNNYDIWFDGITPSYTGVLWIGTDVNIELSNMSVITTNLWGKIMDQIPNAKEGSFPEAPENVIRYGGEYYTSGTEVGLSTYKKQTSSKKKKTSSSSNSNSSSNQNSNSNSSGSNSGNSGSSSTGSQPTVPGQN